MLKKILLISCLCAANLSFANVAVDELDYSKTLILAQQGDAKTQFNLGQMYYEGKGVTQSDAQAVSWLHKAADQGDVYAQYILGVMYDLGQDVPQSDMQAVNWYS